MANSNTHSGIAAKGSGLSSTTYSLLVVMLPLLAIPAMIGLGRTDFFLRHGASVWVQANDKVFDLHGQRCDVLIFGDSTAMTGIDPAQVQATTGLPTCNIAVTNAVLAVVGELPLDRFLAHNQRPRVLLVQLSADDLDLESHVWTRTIYAEGLLELLRHGSGTEIRRRLLQHPRETIAFAGYVAGYTAYYGLRSVWSLLSRTPMEEQRVVVHDGFFTPPMPARNSCDATERAVEVDYREVSAGFLNDLRIRYRERAGIVLANVAPMPACDPNLAVFQARLSGVTSNRLRGLPIGVYSDEHHYTAAGARLVSAEVSAEVQAAYPGPR